jgi:ABC-type amino acid transport substrate-binding protein
MMKILILILILSYIGLAQAANITIFTSDFPPFSDDGKGFDIDFSTEVLIDLFGQFNLSINVQVIQFQDILNRTVTHNSTDPTNFAIGTAGITITASREELVDFSPAYFVSGQRILTHSENTLDDVIRKVVRNFFIYFGFLILAIVFLISVATPLAWWLEMQFPTAGKPPIFIDWEAWKDPNIEKWKKMGYDIWITLQWVSFTLIGTKTGYPSGRATAILHGSLKIVGIAIIVVSTATLANVFNVSTSTTDIENFSDLRGKTVCSVVGSSSESFLQENNNGFSVVAKGSITEMFDSFWTGVCDATVYDFPALQNELLRREDETGNAQAAVVGPVLNEEKYGIALKPGNPFEEQFKRAVIALNNDGDRVAQLRKRWIASIENVEGNNELNVPVALIVVPCVLGIGLTIALVVWLYNRYDDNSEAYSKMRDDYLDLEYQDNLDETLKQEKRSDEYILWNDDRINDQILLPSTLRIKRLLYEIMLKFKFLTHKAQGKDTESFSAEKKEQ